MNISLPNHCLQTLLHISNDMYIVVDIDTFTLRTWNTAFEKASQNFNTQGLKQSFLEDTTALFLGLHESMQQQMLLLRQGEDPCTFAYVPIGTQGLFKARLVGFCEDDTALLIQLVFQEKQRSFSQIDIQNLERRDSLLTATTQVAETLLTDSKNFDITIDTVLGILGAATQVDRVYVWSIHGAPNPEEDDRLYTSQLYEWSEGAEPQQGNDLVVNMLVEEGIPTWIDTFLAGKCVNALVKNMPQAERDVLEPQGIISILTAPIMFHGLLWGFIGFDNCHAEYTWSREEEDILRTAGTLVSTAIHSRRINEALYVAQERFRGVEEATGDIIWSVDAEQNIDYISPRLEAVLQYTPAEIVGKPFNALLLNGDEFVCTATADNFIMRDFELRARCKDGSVKWLLSSCKYSFDAQGNLLSGFGSSSDVTLAHEAQEALQVANKELEEAIKIANDLVTSAQTANAIKGSFLANMSHEIRTPMNAVIGIIHLLKHTQLSEKQKEYIDQIDSSSAALLNIINDILDFSKIQDGNMTIEKHSFTIQSLLNDIKQVAAHWIEERKLDFTISLAPEVEPSYIGDSLRLNQVLTSLVTNAIKFTHEGSVSIYVAVERTCDEGSFLHFYIKDTGIGISEESRAMLFESFTQADISSTRRYGGIGLGLALCRHLTVLMGGDIWCESIVGQGSTFHFTCRLERVLQKEMAPKPLKNISVLVAFPDENSFAALKKTLDPLGYARLQLAKDCMSMKAEVDSVTPPDVIILHHKFAEASVIESVLTSNVGYFNAIPLLYFSEEQGLSTFARYTHLPSLEPSVLHDAFVNVLGAAFEPDPAMYEQGFEQILRAKHGGKHILLVEDNEINQMIAQSILEDVGLRVTVANDGLEGCELIYKDNFDLVIMDIQMPRMDGLSAARKIREDAQFAHIPIIALTAHAMESDREKSLNAGMDDHTTKPIDPPKLFKILLYWLDKQ